jgi:putative Holliday junction resolvase
MRIMALDLGSKRIGVAITDESGQIALPLVTLDQDRKWSDRLRRIHRLATQHNIEQFVVGLPVQMDGVEGEAAQNARRFGERLAARTSVPVDFIDERLTSVEAESILVETGVPRERRREIIDQTAAVLILQSWMLRKP